MWWLVSTQNPLKKKEQLVSLQNRLNSALSINKNYNIRPLALEYQIGTYYSYDTIIKLKIKMPRVDFFWIIGADNLYNMHKWYKWKKLFYLCPIIVFNRPGYFYKSLSSKAAKYFWKNKVNIRKMRKVSKHKLPLWSFIDNSANLSSSTEIRKLDNYIGL